MFLNKICKRQAVKPTKRMVRDEYHTTVGGVRQTPGAVPFNSHVERVKHSLAEFRSCFAVIRLQKFVELILADQTLQPFYEAMW